MSEGCNKLLRGYIGMNKGMETNLVDITNTCDMF